MEHLNTTFKNISTSYLLKPSAKPVATVIFIHGFPFNKTIWEQQLEQLPQEVRGIAYDIRGFGESTSDHSFLSIDLFAQDLIQLIEVLNLENCVLCGVSMGGYIALRAFELHQDKIKGLILCDTNCIADGNESKQKRFATIEQIIKGGKNDFTESFIKNVFSDTTLEGKPEIVQFLREVIMSTANEIICSTQLAMASRTDTSSSLQHIKVPSLIVRGEKDKLMSEEQTRQLVEGITGSECINIPDSGHLPNLENPESFNVAINNFLNKHFLS